MDASHLLDRISLDPDGKPWIESQGIWVSVILTLMAVGWSTEEILDTYPLLEEDDVLACIAWSAQEAG